MWVAPAVVRCAVKLLSSSSSSSSFPKPKFLSAFACLLDSNPSYAPQFDSPASVAAEVNRLKHDPDRAFSFFCHLDSCGLPLDPLTYASFISILSPFTSRSHLDFVFSRLITSFHATRCSAIPSLLDSLALLGGHPLLLRSIDFLVKAYVRAGLFDDAINTLFGFKRGGLLPCVSTCNFLLNSLIESGNPAVATTLYEMLKLLDFIPNDYTYTILIKALCRTGNLDGAAHLLFDDMVEAGVTPNSFAYTTYLEGLCTHCRSDSAYEVLVSLRNAKISLSDYAYTVVLRGFCAERKLEDAKQVMDDMEEHGIVPDVYCYAALIHGHCKSSNLKGASDLHDSMLSKGIESNCFIKSIILQCICDMGMCDKAVHEFNEFKRSGIFLDKVIYNIALNALCKLERMEAAADLLEEMKGKGMVLDIRHYTTLIGGYCLRGDICNALGVLKQMKKRGFQPDIVTYNVLAHGYSRVGLVCEAHELLRDMDACGVKPNVVTHNMIIEGLCISGKVKEAEVFFSGLQEKSIENKAAMFKGYCQANHLGKAFKFFMELSEAEKKSIKKNSCFKLLDKLFAEGDHVTARELLNKMLDLDMEPTRVMYRILMATLCKDGDMRNAQWLFVRSMEKGSTLDVATYTLMMDRYFRQDANCLPKVRYLLREMKNRGVELDVIAYTVLFHGYSKVDSEANNVIKRLWLEMKDKKIAPDVKCYTVLIDRHCKLGNIEEAEDLLRKMIENGLQPDVVDLDLRNYERFLDITLHRDNNITTGKIYQSVLDKERTGVYLRKTVQVVPHSTYGTQVWIQHAAMIPVDGQEVSADVCVIELGGTIGDIESMPFIEALGQFSYRVGAGNFCLIYVSLVPVLNVVGEQKTKPTQHSVRGLRGLGLTLNILA